MIYVIVSFDTEDVCVPETDDAALRIARTFSARQLCATFKLVGEKLRVLEQRGRNDVMDALRQHDVGYHTNLHSVHPTPAEYLREMDWSEGAAEFIRREEQGVKDIMRVFGRPPVCYGQPGGSWAPQVYGALRWWGIPAYVSSNSFVTMGGRPFYYCGVFSVSRMQPNQMNVGFDIDTAECLERLKAEFLDRHRALQGEGGGVISITSHPLHWVLDGENSDTLNLAGGRNAPRSAWRMPLLKSAERSEAGYKHLSEFVEYAAGLDGVQFCGVKELAEQFADGTADAEIDLGELLILAANAADAITFQRTSHGHLSAAEIFHLISSAVAEYAATQELPDAVHVRGMLGPVRFSQTTVSATCIRAEDILGAARAVAEFAQYYGRIPSEIHVNGGALSPEDYLVAAIALLEGLAVKNAPAELPLRKGKFECGSLVSEEFAQAAWRWRMFPDGFSAPKLLDLAKLQAWSLKPAY